MLIGITGKKQHGKSTVANMIASEYGFHVVSFAEPIKHMLCGLFGWDYDQCQEGAFKETPRDDCYGRTPRDLMLSLGTAWGREMVNENIWTDAALRSIDSREKQGNSVVVPDVRFNNEAEAIKSRNGFIISVERTGAVGPYAESIEHISEEGIRSGLIDFTVSVRSGRIDTLKGLVRGYIERYIS